MTQMPDFGGEKAKGFQDTSKQREVTIYPDASWFSVRVHKGSSFESESGDEREARQLCSRWATITAICGFVALITCSVIFQVSSTMESVDQTVTGTDFKKQGQLYPDATIVLSNYAEWEFLTMGSYISKGNVFENCSFWEQHHTFDYYEDYWNDTYLYKSIWGSFAIVACPKQWGDGYAVHIQCEHTQKIWFSFAVVPKHVEDVVKLLNQSHSSFDYYSTSDGSVENPEGAAHFFTDLAKSEFQWIDSDAQTKVLLVRRETYMHNRLQKVEIKTQISVASANPAYKEDGIYFTNIGFYWANGEIYTMEKFQNGSYFSLIVLCCTVVLALERTFAFIKRTKFKTTKS